MGTKIKNKILIFLSAVLFLISGILGVGFLTYNTRAKADDVTGTPTLTVEANNLSYSDSVYILYAVSNEGFDREAHEIKMLFWDELQEEYVVGTEKYAKTNAGAATVKGKPCYVFYSNGLAAKEMTTDIFARAYVEIDGVAYYSDVIKFSILEYVHSMFEKGGLTTNQQNLFNNMLNYGASAQYQFNHNVDRIANGTYYSITIINGKLPDGFAHGRYKNKESIKVKADKAPNGMKFAYWIDENGIIISYDEHIEIELKGNKTYEAVYKDISNVATQLVLNAEIPYDSDVSEVELPTAVSFDVNGETVILEVTWNTESFKTEQIGTQTFYATLVDQSAYDKYNIARDGIVMHVKTMPYTFEIDQTTGEYILTGYYGADTEITLPTSYRNTFVTTIASKAFNKALTLTNVVIPNTYKKIEQSAFFLCDNIAEITVPFTGESATSSNSWFGYIFGATSYDKQYTMLPLALKTVNLTEGATVVKSNAFYGCQAIENFNLPSTITSISDYAFQYCTLLTEFTIPDNLTWLGYEVFIESGLKRVNASSIDKVFAVGNSPFGSGADLYIKGKLVTEVTIPTGYTTINRALSYCTSVTKVTIPNSVTSIGYQAFLGCSSLAEIVIPDSVTSIASSAFGSCSSLTEIVIPDGVTSIGGSVFQSCDSLTSVVIGDGVTSISYQTFYGCSSLTSVVIPDSVTSIGNYAFYGCSSLTSVDIPEGVTSIDYSAFNGCTNLKSMVIPDSVTSIGQSAFYNCGSLTEITIPALVYDIGSYAFYDCKNLAKVTILSQRLTNIGSNAFYNCTKLWEIYNLSSLQFTIGADDFGGIAKYAKVIHTSLDEAACVNVTEDGFITYKKGEEVTLYHYVGKYGDITIPNGVTSIGERVFYYCSSLTSVNIPDGVTSIGVEAFSSCKSLASVTIPDSVTSIGKDAFYACTGLMKVYITDIGAWCNISFANYAANPLSLTENLYFNNNLVKELVIPDGVTSISDYAFYGCESLTSVIIGDDVTSIGNSAFERCSGLTSVVIGDGVTNIGYAAFQYCGNLMSVVIGENITNINDSTFQYCHKLVEVVNKSTYITITKGSSSNGYVGYYALAVYNSGDTFTGTKLSNDNGYIVYTDGNEKILVGYEGTETDLVLPSYITAINQYAFYNCDSLMSVVIGNSVTSIGTAAFQSCDSLTSVVIGDGVISIGREAFYGCSSLTEIVIPDSVTSIDYYAFCSCTNLTSVVIGDNVTRINDCAFQSCYKLVEVVNKSTHITVEKGETSNGYVGHYALAVYNSGDTFTETKLSNDNGYIIYTDGEEKILLGYNGTETDLVLPSYITAINQYAFYNCSSLTSITIPENVTSIGKYAFYYCTSLTSVNIPDSVTSIGDYAFYYCTSLTKIVIPDSVTSIDGYAFYYCRYLAIYCEAESKPSGWVSSWNYSNCPVHWGYKGE